MALSEKLVKEQLTPTPDRYASRVRWLAIVYLVLNPVSLALVVLIAWRVQFFITIAQRSNVETLVLAIIFVLGAYYLATTFRGFLGALRLAWLNMPGLWARTDEARLEVERKKQASLKSSEEPRSAYFDQAVRLRDKPDEPIRWQVGDKAGKLG
ncbi:MAG TPA: hypothetical protein VLQ48_05825, partial [Chloroflexia bacterium]|nr:hypothetical protein [Chloroflexia bacterium]